MIEFTILSIIATIAILGFIGLYVDTKLEARRRAMHPSNTKKLNEIYDNSTTFGLTKIPVHKFNFYEELKVQKLYYNPESNRLLIVKNEETSIAEKNNYVYIGDV